MHVSIASRLAALRKDRNLSQEELAEKIGVSRQAISKWERAEASPDTDNLILLARLYQVSLDDLLLNEDSPEIDPVQCEKETAETEKKEYVSIGLHGIHVRDKDGSEVHIGKRGVFVNDKGHKHDYDWEEAGQHWRKHARWNAPICLVILLLYCGMGLVFDVWHPTWLLFLFVPLLTESIAAAQSKGIRKKFHRMPVPILVVLVYLSIGFLLHIWAHTWVVFLFIPLYYVTVDAFFPKKEFKTSKEAEKAVPEDDETVQ